MIRNQHYQGYNILQCPEITSSSDLFVTNNSGPNPIIIDRPIYSNFLRNYSQNRLNSRNRMLQPNYERIYVPVPREPSIPVNPPVLEDIYNYYRYSTRNSLLLVVIIFSCSLLALFLVYANFPKVTDEERQYITLPLNIEQAKNLGIVLDRYKDDHFMTVLSGVFLTYIFLQTFAIPGSLFLSILSGFLFPFYMAIILVCFCSAIGATLCFLLSKSLGQRLISIYFPEKVAKWAIIVERHRNHILNYIIFLRVTPFLPNWFINLTAPMIGVPLVPFALGTFLGVAPPSFVAIQAGQTLHTMTSSDTGFSWSSVLLLAVFAFISLIPVLIKQKLKEKFE